MNETTAHAPITGLAAGPDGALYVACPSAVFKVKTDRTFSTLIDPIRLEGCDVDYPDRNTNNPLPSIRGLAVDKHGTVFAAGTGCHCVVKITTDGKAEAILKVERPGLQRAWRCMGRMSMFWSTRTQMRPGRKVGRHVCANLNRTSRSQPW